MNSAKKESISITAIINEVNQFDNLEEKLQKRDREPVWDGELRLYQSEINKSNEIVGRIPVQVKSIEEEKDTKDDNIYYRVKVSDIENYKKDKKGAIFFVVQIFQNRQTSIFYKVFDLEEIDNILSSIRKGQKTLKIEFEKLEKNKLDTICIQFIKKLNIYKEFIPVEKVEVYEKKTICYDYNTKYEFEEMKKANEVFYETEAYKQAVKKLEKQNVIILHGEPWVGKTSTARKLVMDYINQGYMFVYGNVDDLVKIKSQVAIDGKIICLIDDFLGSNVEYLEKNVAESTLDKIIGIFKNSKDKKLIMTTRTYIYNNCKQLFYKFYNSTGIKDEYLIDVADYNYLEKGNILYNHLKKNKLIGTNEYKQILNNRFYETIIRHENFNPGVIALICERMKNRNISNINEYIEKVLKDPDRLWEEEYQKLSEYEKILLTIIVLFGVDVAEQYVKEQFYEILKDENRQIEPEELLKSIDRLTVSFIKVTFDKDAKRKLGVCKHSISDYIINKIRKDQINIKRYIKSAKYVEVLHYIDLIIIEEQEWVREELAKKVESDIKNIKSFLYDKCHVLYGILERKINDKRQKLLKQIILELFRAYDIDLMLDILEYEENSNKPLYKFCLDLFRKYIIELNNEEYLYSIGTSYNCEIYFNICLRILNYEKNSNYMIENLEDVKNILIDVVSEDVTSTIEEIMLDSTAKEIIEGKTIEKIKIEHINAVTHDEIPSLRKLYSKAIYEEILQELHECCYIYIDEEILEETIEYWKKQPKTLYGYYIESVPKESEKQIKYIQQIFETGISKIEESKQIAKEIDYKEFKDNVLLKVYYKWWIHSFIDAHIDYSEEDKNNPSLVLFCEFVTKQSNTDYSLGGLAKQFLKFVYKKYNISKETDKILKEIVYNNFIRGNLFIEKSDIKQYESKYPEIMQQLYKANLIINKNRKYYFLNRYIYLYIAINEVDKNDYNLIEIIENWETYESDNEYIYDNIAYLKQKVFELYSEVNREMFNKKYVLPSLKCFINNVQNISKSKDKMEIARAITDMISWEIELDKKFDVCAQFYQTYAYISVIDFVMGTFVETDIALLDYAIYQKQLYEKCYNYEEEVYELDFMKILEDKQLRDICSDIKVWDYLYDIYMETIKAIEKLEEDINTDMYNIAEESLYKKYYI